MKLFADLHIHSCLSPCADSDMKPFCIAGWAKLNGLDLISVTDHNSALNLPAVSKVCRDLDMMLLPGIEVTTSEEIHILCYFESIEKAMELSDAIYKNLIVKNDPVFFGEQVIFDENDNVAGNVDKLLIQSSGFTIDSLYSYVSLLGGICVPAHINKHTNSILHTLGFMPSFPVFDAIEVHRASPLPKLSKNYNILYSSDAHSLVNIFETEFEVEINNKSLKDVMNFIKNGKKSI